jgi:hypothetical protein
MKNESAVEWLVNELEEHHVFYDIKNTVVYQQSKEMEKEQLEKELNAFFLFIRNSGEHFIGMPIEQFVKSYLENK